MVVETNIHTNYHGAVRKNDHEDGLDHDEEGKPRKVEQENGCDTVNEDGTKPPPPPAAAAMAVVMQSSSSTLHLKENGITGAAAPATVKKDNNHDEDDEDGFANYSQVEVVVARGDGSGHLNVTTSEKRSSSLRTNKGQQQLPSQNYYYSISSNPNDNDNNNNNYSSSISTMIIGKPILVSSRGNFPSLGSQLGPLFCLGRLGKGTFCSIHKCIQLHYYSSSSSKQTPGSNNSNNNNNNKSYRIAAAKVELEDFQNSGVLDGEAVMLHHLDASLPAGNVPKYLGYYKTTPTSSSQPMSSTLSTAVVGSTTWSSSTTCSAIVMEYLPGEDMHQLRDRAVFGHPSRRMALRDAVYLTANVMLPMLQQMHQVGIVHRDVKPSNVVRASSDDDNDRNFCMVDFGLSKSLVVPYDSPLADETRPWNGPRWIRPPPSSPLPPAPPPTTTGTTISTSTTTTTITNNSTTTSNATCLSSIENHDPSITTTSPSMTHGGACLRKERPNAEFRGTSMYASLRVHQGKDYCPRDDIWSLMYVFCDLVSGGLPWMSHAAHRDRDACHRLKELVHGERDRHHSSGGSAAAGGQVVVPTKTEDGATTTSQKHHNGTALKEEKDNDSQQQQQDTPTTMQDETHQLLMGDEYHLAKYKRDRSRGTSNNDPLPPPLAMSKDLDKVQLLRTAFEHLATLEFWDIPNYELIRQCIDGFLDTVPTTSSSDDDSVSPVNWEHFYSTSKLSLMTNKHRKNNNDSAAASSTLLLRKHVPIWNLSGVDSEPIDEDIFEEAENSLLSDGDGMTSQDQLEGDDADMARLPLEFRYRVAQMEYNTFQRKSCPTHLALRDFMHVALPLVYGEWDSRLFEKGNHRSKNDNYRRELYVKLLDKCLKCAESFDNFRHRSCFYEKPTLDEASSNSSALSTAASKRRKIQMSNGGGVSQPCTRGNDLVPVARVITALENYKAVEEKKNLAPPPRLSFGSTGGFGMM